MRRRGELYEPAIIFKQNRCLDSQVIPRGLERVIAASIWKLIAGNLTAYMEKNVGICNKQLMQRRIFDKMFVEVDGCQILEGFVVLQGSHISKIDDDTIPAMIKERRRNAVAGKLVDSDGVLLENMLFTSPSYAAMFVIGKSENALRISRHLKGKRCSF